jgi:hypothetical protein
MHYQHRTPQVFTAQPRQLNHLLLLLAMPLLQLLQGITGRYWWLVRQALVLGTIHEPQAKAQEAEACQRHSSRLQAVPAKTPVSKP